MELSKDRADLWQILRVQEDGEKRRRLGSERGDDCLRFLLLRILDFVETQNKEPFLESGGGLLFSASLFGSYFFAWGGGWNLNGTLKRGGSGNLLEYMGSDHYITGLCMG